MENNYIPPTNNRLSKNVVSTFWCFIFLFAFSLITQFSNAQVTTVTYNAPASGTWNVPPGVTSINIQAWGGGGAGGGSQAFSNNGGSGGGAGGYTTLNNIAVLPGQPVLFGVGNGGTGANDANGTAGAQTNVSTFSLIANGGSGGARRSGAGGAGGTASGGTTNVTGGVGANGTGAFGGAGGGASNGGAGGAQISNGSGNPGIAPGGAGGGGRNSGFGGARAGGAGGAGRLIITYTLPTITNFSPSACVTPGTPITINGTNFIAPFTVTFNGVPATVVTPISANQVIAEVPAGATSGIVRITTGTGFTTSTAVLTINNNPPVAPITGTLFVCPGATISLSNATPGGVWSSANSAIATVNPTTGVVTGVSSGTTNILYTITSGGCSNSDSALITVHPVASITGPNSVCIGNTISLSASTAGTWSSSDPTIASVDITGVVTGNAEGAATISFIDAVNGCTSTHLVNVYVPPTITSQPAVTQTACSGTSVSFSVSATGSGLTYQWYKGGSTISNGGAISGATSPTLTINPVAVADAASNYYVIVSGFCSPPAQSNDAALIVNQVVNITSHPLSTTVTCSGGSVSISVAATGDGLTYQWFNGIVPLTNTGNVTGADSATLTLNPVALGDASSDYHVVVSGLAPCIPLTSLSGALVVHDGPFITSQPVASQEVCDGDPVSLSIFAIGGGLNYQWFKGGVPMVDGGNISGSNTDTLNFLPATVADSAPDYYCVVTNACTSPTVSSNAEVIVDEKPYIPNQTGSGCSDVAFLVNPVNGVPAGTVVPLNTTYSWNAPVVTGGMTGGSAQSGMLFIGETLSNPTNVPQTATYIVTPTSGTTGGCIGASFTVVVTINPSPYLINLTPSVCSGELLTVSPTHGGGNIIPAGTTYSWGLPSVTGSVTGGTSGSGQASFSQTLTNPTTVVQTATYNVTATSGSCAGSTFTITVNVQPKPDSAGSILTQSVCSGEAIAPIVISNPNAVPGITTYSWTRNNLVNASGMAASGTGDTINGTFTNVTGVPQTVTFSLFATSEETCISLPSTVTVIVNPIPLPSATPASQTVCSGLPFTNVNLSTSNGVAGTTFTWTRDNTIDVTGLPASGSGSSISGTLTNVTGSAQTTTFTITGDAGGCTSTSTFTITVNPAPTIAAAPLTQTLCGGTPITPVLLSNPNALPGVTYSWTRNNTGNLTGMPASGSGASIAGTLTNTTNIDQVTTFTITASAGGCVSTSTTVDVTVMPRPTVTALPGTQNRCNNVAFNINLNNPNNVPGTIISWTRDNDINLTGIPSSGSGTSISGTLTNNVATNQTTIFTITALAPNGCSSTVTASVTVFIDPTAPVISDDQTVCAGSTPTPLIVSVLPNGGTSSYTYQWQSAPSATGPWTNIAGATNSTYAPPQTTGATPTTFYQLLSTSCGTLTSNVISVAVANNLNFTFSNSGGGVTLCSGSAFNPTVTSNQFLGDSNIRYTWAGNVNYITPVSGGPIGSTFTFYFFGIPIWSQSSATLPLSVVNTTGANVTTTVFVTPNIYDNDTNALICSLSPVQVNVTIRPQPTAIITAPAPGTTICSGTSAGISVTTPLTTSTVTYRFTRSANASVTSSSTFPFNSPAIAVGGNYLFNDTLTNTSASVQSVTYTVTPISTTGTCTGIPSTIIINVNPQLLPGTIGTSQTICTNGDPAPFTQLTAATGVGLSYQWQSSTVGATGPWANISGATAATYDAPGPIAQNTWFIRVVTSTFNSVICSVQNTTPVLVTVNTVNPGTVTGNQTICNGGDPVAFTSTVATGIGTISYQWEFSTTGCAGPWTNIGGNVANLDVPAGLAITTYYRRRATAATGICSQYSNCIVVTVNQVTGGTIGSDETLCGNNPIPFTQVAPSTGSGVLTYQWQSNVVGCGGSWANIPGATGAVYDVPPGVTQTTYYKRITISTLNGVPCTADSNCITVYANSVTGGIINGNRTVCNGGDPAAFTETVPATGVSITYQWQSSLTGGVGTWIDIPGATLSTYDVPGPVTQTMYYQRVVFSSVNSVSCNAVSNPVTVFVNDAVPPVMAGDQTVCFEDPVAFTITTPASGSGSSLTYQWQSTTGNCGGPWANIIGATGATYDPPVTSQTTYFRVLFTSTLNGVSCTVISNCIIITAYGKTWNGSAGTNWNNAANWTPNGVPNATHCILVPNVANDPVISGGGFTGLGLNMTILNGGRLDVSPGNNVWITNFVNVNAGGTFNVFDDASLIQTDNVANTGIVNVHRITPPIYRFDYTYWNSPMVMGSYTLGNLSPNTQPDKYYSWNPTTAGGPGNWVQESVATVMNPTKGYIIRGPNTFSFTPATLTPYPALFTGTPNNGDISIPIAVGTMPAAIFHDKMNLIGNPYASAVSANAFLNDPANASVLDGTIYFWTHHAPPSAAFANPFYGTFTLNYSPNGYASWNALGSTNTVPAGYGGPAPNGFIASGQAFFARGLANGTATFTNAMRVANNNNVFFRTTNALVASATEFESHRLWLNFADTDGIFSQILVGYAEGATMEYDRGFDGESLNSGATFYSILEDRSLTIQGRSLPFEVTDQVPLGYAVPTAKNFTIGIDHLDGLMNDQEIYLEDRLLAVIHDLREAPYEFAAAAGVVNDRFVLRYTNGSLGTDNPIAVHGIKAFIKNKKLQVAAGQGIVLISVFDLAGKWIADYSPEVLQNTFESEFTFAQGVYLAKVKLADDTLSTVKLVNGN